MNLRSLRQTPHRPLPLRARVAVVLAACAGLVLLAAACSSSPSSTDPGGSPAAGGATSAAAAVAWIQCVRSHGVPDFPGLSNGYIPKIVSGQQVGVSDAQLTAAQTACQALWPYQGQTQTQQRQNLTQDLNFAHCMRSHGLPNFPDPTDSNGEVKFVLSASRLGANPRSPQILAKAHECQHATLPPGSPLPSVTEVP